jgi:hypothetical protein
MRPSIALQYSQKKWAALKGQVQHIAPHFWRGLEITQADDASANRFLPNPPYRRFRHMAGVMNPAAAAQFGNKPFAAAEWLQSDEDSAQSL